MASPITKKGFYSLDMSVYNYLSQQQVKFFIPCVGTLLKVMMSCQAEICKSLLQVFVANSSILKPCKLISSKCTVIFEILLPTLLKGNNALHWSGSGWNSDSIKMNSFSTGGKTFLRLYGFFANTVGKYI